MATEAFDSVMLDARSHRLLQQILDENPELTEILKGSRSEDEVRSNIREWVNKKLDDSSVASDLYQGKISELEAFRKLEWSDFAVIRILDYLDNAGRELEDMNFDGQPVTIDPIKLLWTAATRGVGDATPAFFEDMLELFRQLEGTQKRNVPTRKEVEEWMERHPSGLDPRVVKLREQNRERILNLLVDKLESGKIRSRRYSFDEGMSQEQKLERARVWWRDWRFHLRFAIRSPLVLSEALNHSLDRETMALLQEADELGIPFFVNPYYLSLLNVSAPDFAVGSDLAIRDYVIYSRDLIDTFGNIKAWEKEDEVIPGEPNAAGWILPTRHAIHRRYPEVAIKIPASRGRACGGLCATCQRMYDFQKGNLNFALDKLKPTETFAQRLEKLVTYYRDDSQLRDILITGGDALMSSNKTLRKIFDAILRMAREKRAANENRSDGEKHAEMVRVRLGTRLPVYLPQRITPELQALLAKFKREGEEVGIKQFLIQTHFVSPMEVTPEARDSIAQLLEAGWLVSNQVVFTAAASRRGHTAKLRQVLCEIGVMPYYTFSVKGYLENKHGFATNARSVQECLEEKIYGEIPAYEHNRIRDLPSDTPHLKEKIAELLDQHDRLFLATDRNVLNLPGVGKSMTFRVIGIIRDGRRVLEFDHDHTRFHSPIIEKMGPVAIIESKTIREYLVQLEAMGEDPEEYRGIYGYSLGATEDRQPLYEYPEYDFTVTDEITHLQID